MLGSLYPGFPGVLAVILLAIFMGTGCVGPQPLPPVRTELPPAPPPPREAAPAPPAPAAEPRPSAPPHPRVRIFPEFVALIAQPGDTFPSLAAKYLQDPSLGWFIAEFNDCESLRPGQELILPLRPPERGGVSPGGIQTVPVITYHKFSKTKADMMTVKEADFERQMGYLRDHGYRVLALEEFFGFLEFDRMIPPKSVVITIDDDWRSAYEIAFPILKKYGYPATLFLYTDAVRDNKYTWDRIAEMSRHGIEVQCHTVQHRNLIKKNPSESFREYFQAVRREMAESADFLRRRLNKDVKYLAYPYGDTNSLVIGLLKKLGYRGAFTVKRGSNPSSVHHYRIQRSMIYGHFDLQEFSRNLAHFDSRAWDPPMQTSGR